MSIDKEEMKKMVNDAVGAYFSSPGKLYHEIERLRAENEKLRKALKPFAEVLTLRDCGAVVFEDIEIDHVYAARKALGE